MAIAIGLGARASAHTIVIGDHATVTFSNVSTGCSGTAVIGHGSFTLNGASLAVVIGSASSAQFGSSSSVLLGYGNTASNGTVDCVVIGGASVQTGASQSVVIGHGALAMNGSSACVTIGSNAVTDTAPGAVTLGDGAFTQVNRGISIGYNSTVSLGNDQGIAFGSQSFMLFSNPQAICIGHQALIGITSGGCDRAIVFGENVACDDGCSDSILMGTFAFMSHSSHDSTAMGIFTSVQHSRFTTVIGSGSSAGSSSPDHTSDYTMIIGSGSSSLSNNDLILGTATIDDLSPRSTAIGANITITSAPDCISVGRDSSVTSVAASSTTIGYSNSIVFASYSLCAGYNNQINDATIVDQTSLGAHIAVGASNTLADGTNGTSVLGINNNVSESAFSIIAGRDNTVEDGDFVVLLGSGCMLAAGQGQDYAILIGEDLVVSAPFTITMGMGATNSVANTMVIGSSVGIGINAIHVMTVKGDNGGALDTVSVTDAPALADQTGLSVVCNIAAVFSNRTVQAAVAPVAGSFFLYIMP
jgi:hypothetical protein